MKVLIMGRLEARWVSPDRPHFYMGQMSLVQKTQVQFGPAF